MSNPELQPSTDEPRHPLQRLVVHGRARWQALSGRERATLRWGAATVAAAALWLLAIAPAWQTVRQAPAQKAALTD